MAQRVARNSSSRVQAEAKPCHDFPETGGHGSKGCLHLAPLSGLLMAAVELVGDFDVVSKPLAWGGDHHKPAVFPPGENLPDRLKV